MADQQTPPAGSEPQATEQQAPSLSGPWAQDVQQAFTDPEVQAQVDAFLRERIQPHVTQVEQRASVSQQAQALYTDLQENPAQTYYDITAELFGEDAADRVIAALQSQGPEAAAAQLEAEADAQQGQQPQLPPEDRALLDKLKQTELEREYNEALDAFIGEGDSKKDIVKDLFHPFVAAANGDFDKAWSTYQEHYNAFKAQFQPEGEVKPDDVPEPPPVIGGAEARGITPPPTEKVYSQGSRGLDEAIDDLFTDMSKSAPPTVGAV